MDSPNYNSNEKRNSCRIQAMIDVSTYTDNKKLDTYMHNLSCSGILIAENPECEFKTDQDCKITIPVSDSKKLELDAKVVWIRDGLVGLSFANMDEGTVSKLHQLILRLVKVPVSN